MKRHIDRLTNKKQNIKIIKKNEFMGVWIIEINGAPYAVDAKHFKDYYKNET